MNLDLPWVLLVLALSVGALALGVRDPRYALGAVLLAVVNIPNRPPVYPALMVGLFSLPAVWHFGRIHPAWGRTLRVLLLILAVMTSLNCIGLLRGADLAGVSYTAGALVEGCLLTLAFVAVWQQWDFIKALHVLRLCGLGSVVLGFIQLAAGRFLFGIDYIFLGRFTFTGIADANYSGLYLLVFISACLAIWRERARSRGAILSLLIFFAALVMTLSRTGIIVAILVSAFALLVPRIRARDAVQSSSALERRRPALAILALLAPVVVFTLGQTSLSDLGHRVVEGAYVHNAERLSGRVDTLELRVELWRTVLGELGPMEMIAGEGDVDVIRWNEERTGQAITLHSLPLTILVKFGLLGLSLAIVALTALLRRAWMLTSAADTQARGVFSLSLILSYSLFVLTISDEIGNHLLLVSGTTAYALRPLLDNRSLRASPDARAGGG